VSSRLQERLRGVASSLGTALVGNNGLDLCPSELEPKIRLGAVHGCFPFSSRVFSVAGCARFHLSSDPLPYVTRPAWFERCIRGSTFQIRIRPDTGRIRHINISACKGNGSREEETDPIEWKRIPENGDGSQGSQPHTHVDPRKFQLHFTFLIFF
jgi:hypothetical protein